MTAKLRWATVELQADLQHANAPVRLGVIVQLAKSEGDIRTEEMAVLGRVPNPKLLPSELVGANPTLLEMLRRWPEAMAQAVAQTAPEKDPLEELPKIWRWNIYVTEIKERTAPDEASIFQLASDLAQEVGLEVPPLLTPGAKKQKRSRGKQEARRWGVESITRQQELVAQ